MQKFIPVLIAYLIYYAQSLANRCLMQLAICITLIRRFQPKLNASELPINVLPGLRGPWGFGVKLSRRNQQPGDLFVFYIDWIVSLIAFLVFPLAFQSQAAYYALMHRYGFHDVLVWISMAISMFFVTAWLIKLSIEVSAGVRLRLQLRRDYAYNYDSSEVSDGHRQVEQVHGIQADQLAVGAQANLTTMSDHNDARRTRDLGRTGGRGGRLTDSQQTVSDSVGVPYKRGIAPPLRRGWVFVTVSREGAGSSSSRLGILSPRKITIKGARYARVANADGASATLDADLPRQEIGTCQEDGPSTRPRGPAPSRSAGAEDQVPA